MAKKEEVKEELKAKVLEQKVESLFAETSAYGEPLKLPDDEHRAIIKDIERHVEEVKAQRQELFIEEEWQEGINLHDGNVEISDFPYEDAPNLHIHVTSMTDNILKGKIKKNTFVSPMMIAQPIPSMQKYDKGSVEKKQKYINNNILGEMEIETELDKIYDDTIQMGTGIAKVYHAREIEVVRMLEIYEPTVNGLKEYTYELGIDRGSDEYKKNIRILQDRIANGSKENLEVWVEKEQIIKYQPVVKWVDPFNLFIDCYTTDLRYHRVIAEKKPDITWAELKSYFDNEFFEDESILEALIKKYPNEEYRKRKYTLWESHYIYKAKDKNQKELRTVMTYIEEFPDKLCKAITFPYIINKPNYEIYTIIPRRGSIYGIGIPKLLRETNLAINKIWNLMLAAGEYSIAPPMVANITGTFDPSIKQRIGPATLYMMGATDKLQPIANNYKLADGYQLLEYMHRYTEWITGISAYMSGRESPLDPNAPASKAYMLLQESNLRISEYIKQIGRCNSKLFEQIDALYYQYFINDKKYIEVNSDDKQYYSEDITHKELGIPVKWIPQLSDISTNKALEKEENFKIGTFLLSQEFINKMPNAIKTIYEIMLRSAGGEWEKQIDTLLPEKDEANLVSKLIDLMQTLGPKGVMDMMAQLMQKNAPAGAPAMQGGQPPEMATGITNPAQQVAGAGMPQEMISQGQ